MADEHYYFKNLSVQNGLSQNTVNAILQDKQGFMWFGTKDGLNRYDGLSFCKFKHDDRTRRSIGNNFITALYEDAKGNIWVGTDVGLYIYNPEKDSFRHFAELSAENTKIEHTVTAISGDNKGCVWVAVESQGLFCYDLEEGILQNHTLKNFSFPPMSSLLFSIIAEPFGLAAMAMDFFIRKTVCKPFILMYHL